MGGTRPPDRRPCLEGIYITWLKHVLHLSLNSIALTSFDNFTSRNLPSPWPSQSARRLVNIIKSSVSKLFISCTIRHIAMYVVMTYVHTDIVHKRPPHLINVLESIHH